MLGRKPILNIKQINLLGIPMGARWVGIHIEKRTHIFADRLERQSGH